MKRGESKRNGLKCGEESGLPARWAVARIRPALQPYRYRCNSGHNTFKKNKIFLGLETASLRASSYLSRPPSCERGYQCTSALATASRTTGAGSPHIDASAVVPVELDGGHVEPQRALVLDVPRASSTQAASAPALPAGAGAPRTSTRLPPRRPCLR